jgi:transcription antitermination factor NusG
LIGWHILLTVPNEERRAADRLRRFGMPTYWPNYSVTVRLRAGLSRNKLCAMIPGYLFLPTTPLRPDAWRIIGDTASVRGFLRNSNAPAVLTSDQMQDVMFAEARLNEPAPKVVNQHDFRVGQRAVFGQHILAVGRRDRTCTE